MKKPEVSPEEQEARRRRGRMSRNKGARAELEVAALIQEWWQEVEPGVFFKRVPLSGGWANAAMRKNKGSSGDLTTDAKRFPFVVEVKRNEEFSMSRVLMATADEKPYSGPVWKYWAQAREQADEAGGVPLLVFRNSGAQWWCLVPATRYMHARVGRPGFVIRGPRPEDRAYLVEFSKLLAVAPRVFLAPVAKTG